MKKIVAMIAFVCMFFGLAEPAFAGPGKFLSQVINKVCSSTARVAGRAAGSSVVKGSAALAAVEAKRAARVTPKVILASGASVAGVTAAYKVSDGCQEQSYAMADAIRNNPDIAKKAIENDGEHGKWGKFSDVVVVAFGLCMMLFFWKRMVSAEKWIKERIARWRDKKKSLDAPFTGVNGEEVVVMRPGKINVKLMLMLLAVSTAIVLGVKGVGYFREVAVREEARAAYEERATRLVEQYEVEVKKIASDEFGRVRAMIPDVVDEFGDFDKCLGVCKKVMSGDEEDWGYEERYYAALRAANDKVSERTHKLLHDLSLARKECEDKYRKILVEQSLRVDDKKAGMQGEVRGLAIDVGIEAGVMGFMKTAAGEAVYAFGVL